MKLRQHKRKLEELQKQLTNHQQEVKEYRYLVYGYNEIRYAIQFKDWDLHHIDRHIREIDDEMLKQPGDELLVSMRKHALEKRERVVKEREKLESRQREEYSAYTYNCNVLSLLERQQHILREELNMLQSKMHA